MIKKMTYVCMECGNEVDYEYLMQHKLKCTKCKEKRSNIWVKQTKGATIRTVKSV